MMRYRVSLLVGLGLLVLGSPLLGQVRLGPRGPEVAKDRKRIVDPANQPREIFLAVDTADESMPALKNSMMPNVLDKQIGNAATFYYRAFSMMAEVDRGNSQQLFELLDASPQELIDADVGKTLEDFENVFQAIHTASMRERCDWEWRMQDLEGINAIYFLLPEVQQLRELGRLVAIRARWQIATGQYEQAVESLKDGYQLAMNTAQPRSLVTSLVGLAISAMMNEQLIELIRADDSPNMYWAIAQLPRPLVDIRRAIELEVSWPDKLFPMFRDAETADRSPEEWQRLFRKAAQTIGQMSNGQEAFQTDLMVTALMMRGYVRAKKQLAEQGYTMEQLDNMPAAQVVAIYQARVNRYLRDEIQKWSLLPYHLAWQRQQEAEANLQADGYFGKGGENSEILPIASLLFPALSAARMAEARSTTHLNFLQTVEAIRMHAARNDGQLPKSLSEIKVVPPAKDPVTLEDFDYELIGREAVLTIPPSGGRRTAGRWTASIRIKN